MAHPPLDQAQVLRRRLEETTRDLAAGLSLGVNAFTALTLGVLGVPGLGLLLLLKNF